MTGFLPLGGDALGAAGDETPISHEGTLSATLGAVSSTASGEVGNPVHGLLSQALDNVTLTASGSVIRQGQLSVTLDAFTLSATAESARNGAAAVLFIGA